jgi:hypothetical protein
MAHRRNDRVAREGRQVMSSLNPYAVGQVVYKDGIKRRIIKVHKDLLCIRSTGLFALFSAKSEWVHYIQVSLEVQEPERRAQTAPASDARIDKEPKN